MPMSTKKSKPPKFKPHAYALAKPIQGQIWAIAVNGVDCLRIEIDTRLPSAVWMRYALAHLPTVTLGFERPHGVRIAYRHDFCVDYDLNGMPLATYDRVVEYGKAHLTLDADAAPEDRLAFAALVGIEIDTRPTVD